MSESYYPMSPGAVQEQHLLDRDVIDQPHIFDEESTIIEVDYRHSSAVKENPNFDSPSSNLMSPLVEPKIHVSSAGEDGVASDGERLSHSQLMAWIDKESQADSVLKINALPSNWSVSDIENESTSVLTALRSENYYLRSMSDSYQSEMASLKSRLDELTVINSNAFRTNQDIKGKLELYVTKCDKLTNNQLEMEGTISDAWAKIKILSQLEEDVRFRAENAEAFSTSVQMQCESTEHENVSLRLELAEVKSLSRSSESRIKNYMDEQQRLIKEKTFLEHNLKQIIRAKMALEENRVLMRKEIDELKAESSCSKELSRILKVQLDERNVELYDLKSKLADSMNSNLALTANLNAANISIQNYLNDLDEIKFQKMELELELKSKSEECSDFLSRLQLSEKKNDQLNMLMHDYELKLTHAEENLQCTREEANAAKSELSKQKELLVYISKLSSEIGTK